MPPAAIGGQARTVTKALEAAFAAYPEARVDLGDKAIALNPARPPIARIA